MKLDLPKIVQEILLQSAYDTKSALQTLDIQSIEFIEGHIEENREILSGSVYENKKPFKLLPGHKGLILAIPQKIGKLHSDKKTLNKNKQERQIVSFDDDQIELQKKELIAKLEHFCKNTELHLELNVSDICELKVTDDRITCLVCCPYCQAKYSCFKKILKHWAVSNIESHFKKHKAALLEEFSNRDKEETVRTSQSNQSELNAILNA